jgi:hypothetical protein
MFVFYHENAGQNQDIKITNKLFENVSHFSYWGMTVTTQNLIQTEIKRSLILVNAYYSSVQNLPSSRLLLKT